MRLDLIANGSLRVCFAARIGLLPSTCRKNPGPDRRQLPASSR